MSDQEKNIENEWVRGIKNGNEISFESLFNAYCQKLINFSRRYVQEKDIAENIVQDVFVNLWINRSNLDYTKSIKSYLFTAAKNNSYKHLRHLNVERSYSISKSQDTVEQNPQVDIETNERSKLVNHEIEKLPDKCREIFVMSKFDKFKYSEIADILDISIKTVETQMGRALKKLKENLKHLIIILIYNLKGF
jgi:RNA polymerase sigma-70 factor (ECF subfamily)